MSIRLRIIYLCRFSWYAANAVIRLPLGLDAVEAYARRVCDESRQRKEDARRAEALERVLRN